VSPLSAGGTALLWQLWQQRNVVDDCFVRLTDRPRVAARQAGEIPEGVTHEGALVRRRTDSVSLTGWAGLGWHGGSTTLSVRGSSVLSHSRQSKPSVADR